ncbi:MAG: hypothetical protein KDC57_22515 [Saprospiraceae bacterium]|nr:hypothetical protein [Saprospiraceae bacterium]
MKSFIGKTAFILGLMATTLVARANNLDSILVVPHFSAFPAFILQTDELKQETQVRIWDAKGGLVWSQSVSPNANDKLFNLRHLPEGTYDIEMDNDQVFITQKLEISNGKASIVAGSTESVLFPEILQAGGSVIVDTRLSNVANMSLEINDDATAFLKQDIVPGKIYRFVLQDFGKGAYDIKVAADGKYRTKTIYR